MFVLLITLSYPSYLVILNSPTLSPNGVLTTFTWIILPLILCSLVYSTRTTILFSATNIILMVLLPSMDADLTLYDMGAVLGFYSMASIFIVIVMDQRNQIENDRQKELVESRNKIGEEAAQRKKFGEQAQRRADLLVMLNEIGRDISTLTDLPSLMEKVYWQVRNVLSADFFFIGLYDKDRNEISFPFMYDYGKRWEQSPSPVTDDTFSGKTILTKKPLLINEWSDTVQEGESPPSLLAMTRRSPNH